MDWNKEDFYNFIKQNNVINFFEEPVKLKSGNFSHWYVNWRTVAEDVFALDKLSDYVIQFVKYKRLKPDCFIGVPEGVTKLGIITQYKWAKAQIDYSKDKYSLPMGRGNLKSHGELKDQIFLGIPKGKVIVLEDVITTGESLITTIKKLVNLKTNILSIICLTHRNELDYNMLNVMEFFEKLNIFIEIYSMSNLIDLLPKMREMKKEAFENQKV